MRHEVHELRFLRRSLGLDTEGLGPQAGGPSWLGRSSVV